jgi:polygalacturonase
MCPRRVLIFVASLFCSCTVLLPAQDTRPLTEPTFPSTCVVLNAPLQSTASGPTVAETADAQNTESAAESEALTEALEHCGPNQAVELTLGSDSSHNAFLINPVDLPRGVSLIIDGGVTVFASRDPRNYQNSDPAICGTYGPSPTYGVNLGCHALITMEANSGIYGYGVIDGQAQKPFIFYQSFPDATAPPEPYGWWDLTIQENRSQDGTPNCPKTPCAQASPILISGGDITKGLNQNLVLYKITIRNPPYHTVNLGGEFVTVWGVKVQAPWNIPNTDGFDLHASNSTIYDTTVANGDQEVALVSSGGIPTTNITVDHFNGYSKGGITVLGSGDNFSQLLIQNVNITGDVPSVIPNQSVNGLPVSQMTQLYNITTYGQALPTATNDLKAIQITDSSQTNTTKPGADISGVTFKSFCIQDIVDPINFTFSGKDELPNLHDVTLQDVHILAPTNKFPGMNHGVPTGKPGGYQLSFVTHVPTDPTKTNPNQFILDNVVVDDYATDAMTTSIASIDAEVNNITTATNIYPPVFNGLGATGPNPIIVPGPPKLTLLMNSYSGSTNENSSGKAYNCSMATMPFVTGDLYLSLGSKPATGDANNLQSATIASGGSITLNAVVQPTMSQTTNFEPDIYGANPGLLAVGSPALTNAVTFYDNAKPIGVGTLSANGTLATLVVSNMSVGTHTFTAMYPKDTYYANLNFGSVTVQVPAIPPVMTSPTPGSTLTGSTVTFQWTAGSGVTAYQLAIGTYGPGYFNLGGSQQLSGSTTSFTATNIPTDSQPVYITLSYKIDGVWQKAYYTYTTAPLANPPVITSPSAGSILPGSTATFQWATSSSVSAYQVSVGTYGPGYFNLGGSQQLPGSATSYTVTNLPTNSQPVYITLRYLVNNAVWQKAYYTYITAPLANPPVITSPAAGSVLPGSNVTFHWTSNSAITAYALSVGTYGPGYYNIYSSPQLSTTSFTVPGIPRDGKPVYVTLRYLNSGVWQTNSYSYTAAK